jgi:hypothetical protein
MDAVGVGRSGYLALTQSEVGEEALLELGHDRDSSARLGGPRPA